MAFFWLKKFLFNFGDEKKSELEEETRIIKEIQQSVDEDRIVEKEIGIVTLIRNGLVEINNTWVANEDLLSLKIGTVVAYSKPKNPESNVVSQIELLQNIKPRTAIESSLNYGVIYFIDEEKILVNPGSLLIWKNDTEVTFSPQIGDCIKLESYENNLKLQPQECKVVTADVTVWDGKSGFLNGHIRISQEACESCYVLKEGDTVISSIIPCEGDGYRWRCLNVKLVNLTVYRSNKKIDVKNIPVFLVSAGKEKVIDVQVKNTSLKALEVKHVQIIPKLTNAILINNPVKQIEPGIEVTYRILCNGVHLGWTVFKLEFKFRTFVYNRNVKFLTVDDDSQLNMSQQDKNPGQLNFVTLNRKPNFLRIKPKAYEIPSYLLEIFGSGERDILDCMYLIQEKLPALRHGLTLDTYALYFHTLLFLEELSQIHQMDKLETVAPLIKRGQYYVFIFEEGTNYSTLCPGDTVLLSNPWVEDDSESPFEAKVFMRKENEIYLNFKDIFNVIGFQGTLFRMKFRNCRTCIIRTHHAIDYFLKNIDVNWLFPHIYQKSNMDVQSSSHGNVYASKRNEYFFKELNEEQKNAVDNIVFRTENINYPYLIFGPPGTGKTFTLVELTLQTILHFSDYRILIAAHSNSAVDTFCELLISSGIVDNNDLLRLISYNYSHQGQLPVNLVEYSATLNSENIGDIRSCDKDDIGNYKIVAGTLSTLGILNCIGFKSGHFTHIFIDEAGQTTEPETLIPLAGMKPGHTRVVLAGDPNQLGPVITSQIAREYQLGESLMMRLMNLPIYSRFWGQADVSFKPKIATMLRKNYRSLPTLVDLTSNLFYKGQLVATLSTCSREAKILNDIKKTSFGSSGSSLIVIKVYGKEILMQCEGNSYSNLMEAAKVSRLVLELYKTGIETQQIGVITPYSLQVKEIRKCFKMLKIEPPKIGTVEEFQGSERDIIIISLVRTSLDECRLSFISEPKRANVALSRAKVLNIIVANETTLRLSRIWIQVLNKAHWIDPTEA